MAPRGLPRTIPCAAIHDSNAMIDEDDVEVLYEALPQLQQLSAVVSTRGCWLATSHTVNLTLLGHASPGAVGCPF